jgi:hypothetical protein
LRCSIENNNPVCGGFGGFRDFDLASDGSIIAVYGKPHKNGIYRLHARGKKFKKFIDFSPLKL